MKMHYITDRDRPEYVNRPHIYEAISHGEFSLCRLIAAEHIVTDIKEVTCKKCLELYRRTKHV